MTQKFGKRRQNIREETCRIIQDTAYALFEEKGYEKTTMRELASKAGVGLGTIFQHFPDKPSLLTATFEEDLGKMVEEGLLSFPQKSKIKDQLLHIVRPVLEFYAKRPKLARVLIKQAFFLDGKAGEKLDALEVNLSQKLAGLFHAAIERGEIDPQTNIEDAVTTLWAYYNFILLFGLKSDDFDVDTLLEKLGRLLDQHLDGIKVKKGDLT